MVIGNTKDVKITVIGAGSWGTTLANLLACKGYKVKIWAHEEITRDNINKKHENIQYLKGVRLSENLSSSCDLSEIVPEADLLVSAVPSSFVRDTAKKLAGHIKSGKEYMLVTVSKGLEYESFKLMSEVIKEELPENVKVAALSGPNHAEEVSRKMPTATAIASIHEEILEPLVEIFHTDYFKPYPLSDEYGVEICGAVKNITAVAIGICDGLGLGDNAKASIMTLGLTEMNRIGKIYGVKRGTFFGIAGVGDLIATCTSKQSRNRFFGEHIAMGKSLEQIKQEMNGMVAEGAFATKSVYAFGKKNELKLPLTGEIYRVLYENKKLEEAVKDLIQLI